MTKKTITLKLKEFYSCGYTYRIDLENGDTLGYLSLDEQGSWMYTEGSTPFDANNSDPVSFECYTLDELVKELEDEYSQVF